MTAPADAPLTILLQQQTQIATDVSSMRADLGKAMTRLEVVDTWRQGMERANTDHEARLRLLERFRYTLAGLAVVGGTFAGYVGYLMGHYLH